MSSRFARHALIPGWRQKTLASATAVVIGVGALGNEVARLLTLAGVGHIVICDPDTVSESNLSRTTLFRRADIGRSKVTVAAEALRGLADQVHIDAIDLPHINGVGLALLRDASLVISCVDSMAARIQLAIRCNAVDADLLDAGTHPWGGEVCYYSAGGPCLGCVLGEEGRGARDDPWSCSHAVEVADAGASAPVSALVGSWQATFAVRILLGLPVNPAILRVDAYGATSSTALSRKTDCPLHDRLELGKIEWIGSLDKVADVLATLEPGEEAFAWTNLPGQPTSLLRQAAPGASLASVGVARKEILPTARRGEALVSRYLELGDPL